MAGLASSWAPLAASLRRLRVRYRLYFNDDDYGDNSGSFTFCTALSATATVTFVDAQGFQPQLDEYGNPWLLIPITSTVAASFDRVGALTDGASLIVVQLSTGVCSLAGWTVTVSDPALTGGTLAAVAAGSLWGGDENNLPPLPTTLADPGDTTITLQDGESAFFYVPPPSWAFDSDTKTYDIQIQVFDQNNNLMATAPFTLYKPPLVLVHGGLGNGARWNNFQSILDAGGITVDLAVPPIDYSANNFSGLDVIYPVLPTAISAKVQSLRAQRIAATRLDVVAHSAGGLVTRWYMTPAAQRPTGARIDPTVTLTTPNGAQVLPLKFKATTIHDDAQIEFSRADNFGVGDIRRLITMGTPHRGMTWWREAIAFFNRVADHKSEMRRQHMTGISFLELQFGFTIVPLDDPSAPADRGMMVLDLAAFDDFDTGAGRVSRVIAGLPPVPVSYAPIEGVAQPSTLGGDLEEDIVLDLVRFAAGMVPSPADTLLTNSDGLVPSASAHNLSCIYPELVLQGRSHAQLGNVQSDNELAPVLVDLLGPNESLYCAP